jgi:hypothetical protein
MFNTRAYWDCSMTGLGPVSKTVQARNRRKSLQCSGSASARAGLPLGEPPAHRTAFHSNIARLRGSVNDGEVQCSGIAMAAIRVLQCNGGHTAGVKVRHRNPLRCVMASGSFHVI